LLAYAALRLARLARLEHDSALSILAGAIILMAADRLCNPPLYFATARWVAPAEGLRLLAFALLFAAGLRAELESRARSLRAALIAERHRVARDLHDGLAQDLAFLAGHVSGRGDLAADHPVAIAAHRALALSRNTISELSNCRSTPTRETLEAVAHELQERFDLEVAVDVRLEGELGADTREQLARIMREAVVNAARHGDPEHVMVSLGRTASGLTLRVRDDGRGLRHRDGRHGREEGFGLRSMRERAAFLDARLTLREGRTGGAELELVMP
jgi:signal transduction histidine kinase